MRSLALANQKGGVGKTTTAVHLAHGLALQGSRVALLDLDPQGNAEVAMQSMASGAPPLLDVLQAIRDGIWLLPSRAVAAGAQVDTQALQRIMRGLAGQVDWVIVDCPPRMDSWGWAGIQLCDEIVIPVQAEFLAMHGLSQMLQTIEAAQAQYPGKCSLRGVLLTLANGEEPITGEIVSDLRKHLGDRVLRTVVWRDIRLVEAASHGQTIFDYQPDAPGAWYYGELTQEIIHGGTATW